MNLNYVKEMNFYTYRYALQKFRARHGLVHNFIQYNKLLSPNFINYIMHGNQTDNNIIDENGI